MLIFMKDLNINQFTPFIYPDGLAIIINNQYYPIFNLSSIYNLGVRLSNLIPKVQYEGQRINIEDDREFDIYYANYIMSYNPAFIDLMSIMNQIYLTECVVVLIGEDEYKNYISDSLMKFIQQRYEYPIHIVETVDDLPSWFGDSYHFTSVLGLSHFDADREKFFRMTTDKSEILEFYNHIMAEEGNNSNGSTV